MRLVGILLWVLKCGHCWTVWSSCILFFWDDTISALRLVSSCRVLAWPHSLIYGLYCGYLMGWSYTIAVAWWVSFCGSFGVVTGVDWDPRYILVGLSYTIATVGRYLIVGPSVWSLLDCLVILYTIFLG